GDYFYKAVLWAVENKITSGATATTFNPTGSCKRAQVVTFLWRAQNSTKPTGSKNPFADVKESDYFFEAVLWAVENKITSGVDDTHFGPSVICKRAQVVTFLYSAMT
ncbi:MAG: S-layer homology domain-containing protein, partial [Lachnospiraceae bacterium]|nr:S-layer homology domain-containing protein [Lachnospiraceae bacterium]